MPHLQVKNVPEEVYDELRRRAGQRHVTIRDYVLALLLSDQRRPTLDDWLADVADDPDVEIDAAAVVAAITAGRDEREAELGPDGRQG